MKGGLHYGQTCLDTVTFSGVEGKHVEKVKAFFCPLYALSAFILLCENLSTRGVSGFS